MEDKGDQAERAIRRTQEEVDTLLGFMLEVTTRTSTEIMLDPMEDLLEDLMDSRVTDCRIAVVSRARMDEDQEVEAEDQEEDQADQATNRRRHHHLEQRVPGYLAPPRLRSTTLHSSQKRR